MKKKKKMKWTILSQVQHESGVIIKYNINLPQQEAMEYISWEKREEKKMKEGNSFGKKWTSVNW